MRLPLELFVADLEASIGFYERVLAWQRRVATGIDLLTSTGLARCKRSIL